MWPPREKVKKKKSNQQGGEPTVHGDWKETRKEQTG